MYNIHPIHHCTVPQHRQLCGGCLTKGLGSPAIGINCPVKRRELYIVGLKTSPPCTHQGDQQGEEKDRRQGACPALGNLGSAMHQCHHLDHQQSGARHPAGHSVRHTTTAAKPAQPCSTRPFHEAPDSAAQGMPRECPEIAKEYSGAPRSAQKCRARPELCEGGDALGSWATAYRCALAAPAPVFYHLITGQEL